MSVYFFVFCGFFFNIVKDDFLINVYFGRVKDFDSQWKQLTSTSWFLSASGSRSVVSGSVGCNIGSVFTVN